MDAFELDMAFAPEELAAGLERVFGKLGLVWSCERSGPTVSQFTLRLAGGGQARIEVCPLPPERMATFGLFPRALLVARADDGADLEALRREILLAFLRVTG